MYIHIANTFIDALKAVVGLTWAWIGMRLEYDTSRIWPPTNANYTDGTPVDYGNPTICQVK